MLKRMINKKIMITTAALFALFLIYLVPKDTNFVLKDVKTDVEYVNATVDTEEIYLLNQHHMLSRTKIVNNRKSSDPQVRAKFIIEALIQDGPYSSSLPNGFQAILPSDTKIVSTSYDNEILKVNFSKELLDIKEEDEEAMIEAITYSVTSIPEIKGLIIYIDNNILTLLPKSKTSLPSTLNRSFGINKKYEFTKTSNINQVTVYYIDEFNGNHYYVPVTKYLNDDREKVNIIVDELTSTNTYTSNLMSFLNGNAKLLDAKVVDNIMELDFNSYIFDENDSKNILEEVVYTIALSVKDNYDVSEVVFKVDTEEIYKSVLKTIE